MALNLPPREARLQVMRGNMDKPPVLQEAPKAEPKPVPVPAPVAAPIVNIDMSQVADAIRQIQPTQQVIPAPAQAPSKWLFKITERDRMGNIISFTAASERN